jgi:hypothetical protein
VRVGERLRLEDGGVERAVEQDLSHGSPPLLLAFSLPPVPCLRTHATRKHKQEGAILVY